MKVGIIMGSTSDYEVMSGAEEMLKTYHRIRPISAEEWENLKIRFTYPEKFWKIANRYYCSRKVWDSGQNYEKLYRENGQLKDELALKEKDLAQYHQLEKNLQDTLLVAQRTAEEVTRAAKTQAEELRANARQACDNMRAQAEMDAQKRTDEASHQVREIVAEYDRLVREKRQFITKVRSLMQSELALLTEEERSLPDAKPAEEPVDEPVKEQTEE